MHTHRPSAAIALILTAIAATGCYTTGSCGDMSFEAREQTTTHALEDDGTAALWDGTVVDPDTDAGCEALCEETSWSNIDEIHSCETEIEDADTGVADEQLRITCVVSGEDICIGGRHSGTLAQRASGQGVDAVSAWLAREACGEAGSVHAFQQLARELAHHGAPAALIAAARGAADDEIRHTRMVRQLAQRRGGTPAPARARRTPPRDLLTIALENAVEGCVHETFAAARAGWQARHAGDAEIRAVSSVLAADEARHADLAAAVHAWACAALPPHLAATVEAARQAAWANLADSPANTAPSAARALGLPSAAAHRRIVQALSAALT